ncbi:hypothetical protein EQH57_0465 [Dictyocoela roeselum]|nr:hypothetical protein EQH57_0465 [Dictyocoela roeselum]
MKIIQITTCGITDKEIEYLQKHLKNIKFKEDSLEETNTHLSHSQPLSREETLSISNSLSLSKIAKDKVMDVIVTKKLTSKTDFIVVNRPMFTKKYIQAIYWRIPIIDIKWLYALGSYKSFKRGIFQNIVFSTSDIKNPIFKNYFIAQGAIYSENLSIKCDFLIADGEGQMTSYAEKVGIPIIGTKDVFKNNYNLFLKPSFYHCSGDQNLFPSNNGGVDKYRKLSEEYPEINEGGLIKGNGNKSTAECSENCEPNDNKIGSDKKIDRLFVENFEILNQITQNNSPGKDEHWDIKIISPLNSQTNRQLF